MQFYRLVMWGLFPIAVMACWSPSVSIAAQPGEAAKTKTVAILIFDGVELLDFAGPAEVFIVASQRTPFRVVTVAPSGELIKTMGGITVKPDFSFKDAPVADILVIPGGNTQSVKKDGVEWIRRSAKSAEIVMSVCFGAFLLAEAELLDGIKATTHQWGINGLKKSAPKCKVVSDQRFVDSGKIITTAGVTAGIDGAIHVVQRLAGADVAKWTAESWMEHRSQETRDPTPKKSKSPQ